MVDLDELEQLSREVVAGERLSFVVRGVGAEAILALIARVRQAERERAAAADWQPIETVAATARRLGTTAYRLRKALAEVTP